MMDKPQIVTDVLYIGLYQTIERRGEFMLIPPIFAAVSPDKNQVIKETTARFERYFKFHGHLRMRCWVLEVTNTLSRPIREWMAAPPEIVVSEFDHDSGVITKTQHKDFGNDFSRDPNILSTQVEISDQQPEAPLDIFDEGTSTSMENEIFIGLHQSYNPEASASVMPPMILGIGEREDVVTKKTKSHFAHQKNQPNLFCINYWIVCFNGETKFTWMHFVFPESMTGGEPESEASS